MLYRKCYEELKQWYEKGTYALLVDGARQVGKTTVIQGFLNDNNIDYVFFDLEKNEEVLQIFNSSKNAEQILLRLSALSNHQLKPGKTIIFVDEVQQANDALTPLKYLVQDGRYRYIFSGSLLGIKLKDIQSIPVGFMHVVQMFPMDFEEFAIANNVSKTIFDYLKKCYEDRVLVDEIIHKQVMNLFNTYLVVGGMPKAVNEYVLTHNIHNVSKILKDIDHTYLMDITKYDRTNKLFIEDVYNLIPNELNGINKRFIFKNLNETARFSKYEESFVWLLDSGVGLFTFNVDNPVYPLLKSKDRSLFKLFLCDIGLLSNKLYGDDLYKLLIDEVTVNYGAVYESFVAQELIAHGFSLYYYNNKKRGEVDFIIEKNNQIIPIEVKSGKDYRRHVALSNLLKDYETINESYVLHNGNLEIDGNKIYYPIYMIMFFQNNTNISNKEIFIPDISHLL